MRRLAERRAVEALAADAGRSARNAAAAAMPTTATQSPIHRRVSPVPMRRASLAPTAARGVTRNG